MAPLLSELVDAYTKDVMAFTDPFRLESAVLQSVLLGITGLYICLRGLEREKFLSALAGSETRYRRLFEKSIDPIAITSHDGQSLEVNHSFLEFFGYAREETKSLAFQELCKSVANGPASRRRSTACDR